MNNAPEPKLDHAWRIDNQPASGDDPATLTLWCDGRYVAHLSPDDAWMLGDRLLSHWADQSTVDGARSRAVRPALSLVTGGVGR